MKLIASLLCGLVFGVGLIISGMVNPGKVLGFLDLAGTWDPSLALVMVGAIAVSLPAFAWARKRRAALLGDPIQPPETNRIDGRLIVGALLFGAGWGIAGFCPGPGIVALGMGSSQAAVFVAAMLAGMVAFEAFDSGGARPD
jgi:uncharacterized protein